MKYLFISFTTLCMALGLANTSAIADNIPSNAAKDKRDSIKAGNKLSRAVSAQCDGNGKTRGKGYQKVWKEIRKLCKGSHIG
ncbi:MAG: hypothetical protein JKY56_04980, partial [Kofleriaceae bacterium]|nr:hypothetical protein [Kofleriaceae bacterium]